MAYVHQIIQHLQQSFQRQNCRTLNPFAQLASCLDRSWVFETRCYRSGVSATTPRRRLRLAHVAWKLRVGYRSDQPQSLSLTPLLHYWHHHGHLILASRADSIYNSLDLLWDAFAPSWREYVNSLSK